MPFIFTINTSFIFTNTSFIFTNTPFIFTNTSFIFTNNPLFLQIILYFYKYTFYFYKYTLYFYANSSWNVWQTLIHSRTLPLRLPEAIESLTSELQGQLFQILTRSTHQLLDTAKYPQESSFFYLNFFIWIF